MITQDVMKSLINFRSRRDWEKFHTPKNLAAAIAIEASELLELFQWVGDEEVQSVARARRADIEREIADVVILLSYLCHDLQIDIDRCVRKKLVENDMKYPVAKAKGNAKKYDQF